MSKNGNRSAVEILSGYLDCKKWGDIVRANEEGPGIFYLATKDESHLVCREFYAVFPEASPQIISKDALTYGTACGDILLFEYGKRGGWELIEFELERYRMKRGIADKPHSIYCTALYAAEKYPEYFGGVTPPRVTPEGLVLRAKKVYDGIFFLETERCQWMLAVSYPIWNCDLTEYTQRLGQNCKQDQDTGAEEAEFLYFSEDACAPALYELLACKEYGIDEYITSRQALETALNLQFPAYVIQHNALEMTGHGQGDIIFNVLKALGCEAPVLSEEEEKKDRERRTANCIRLFPGFEDERLLNLPL